MPYELIVFIFILSVAVQGTSLAFLVKRYWKVSPLTTIVFQLLVYSMLLAVFFFIAIHSPTEQAAVVLYSITLIMYNTTIFFFYMFSVRYTTKAGQSLWYTYPVGAALAFDTVGLVINIFQHQIFSIQPVQLAGERMVFGFVSEPLHRIHWWISIITILFSLSLLIYRGIRSPKLYKGSYFSLLTGVIVVIAVNAISQGLRTGLELSCLIVPFVTSMVFYFAFVHSPKRFVREAGFNLVSNMREGVIILDMDGRCRSINDAALSFLDIERDATLQASIEEWMHSHNIQLKDGEEISFTDENHPLRPVYEVRVTNYYDKGRKDKYTGSSVIIFDNTERVRIQEAELFASRHDTITDLYNREGFIYKAGNILSSASKNEEYYVVCTDIENFKLFNDLFGTEKGDEFLKEVASYLKKNLSSGSVISRINSDKFNILIRSSEYDERIFVNAFSAACAKTASNNYSVNAYIGIYKVDDPGLSVSVMSDRAIMALQSIKGQADKLSAFYDDSLRISAIKNQEHIDELRRALADKEFTFYIQPQFDSDENVPGGEALVRWDHKERGIVFPGEFIPAMEEHGMISELDLVVWEKACIKLAEWKSRGREDMYLSVNISARDFYYMDVYEVFTSLVKKYNINPSNLRLEITESAIMQNVDEQIILLNKLRQEGFIIEMDDFGSGYSSLNMLNKIDVDVLKLDMAFLEQSANTGRSMEIIRLIRGLTKNLDMRAVVEGVETKEQLDALKGVGFELFQGYYFSKPIPIAEYEEKYM